MSVTVKVSPVLYEYTDKKQVINVEGDTVGQCLTWLVKKYPAMKQALLDNEGKLLAYITVYVNEKGARPKPLDKAVADGDNIYLGMAIGGG